MGEQYTTPRYTFPLGLGVSLHALADQPDAGAVARAASSAARPDHLMVEHLLGAR
jgi:hypothetical protein